VLSSGSRGDYRYGCQWEKTSSEIIQAVEARWQTLGSTCAREPGRLGDPPPLHRDLWVQTLAKNLLSGMGFNLNLGSGIILDCAALEPNISLYIFGPWIWTSWSALAAGPAFYGQNGAPHTADR